MTTPDTEGYRLVLYLSAPFENNPLYLDVASPTQAAALMRLWQRDGIIRVRADEGWKGAFVGRLIPPDEHTHWLPWFQVRRFVLIKKEST